MRQRKFTSWHIVLAIAGCILFASGHAMADFTTCTATQGNGSSAKITAVTSGGFPLNFADNNADTQNYCGNTNPGNYPCAVFRYTFQTFDGPGSPPSHFGSTHIWATIPVCPDEQLNILGRSVNFPPSSTGNLVPNDFGDKYDWNYRRIVIPSGAGSGSSNHDFYIAVGPPNIPAGMQVGVGVNDIASYSNSDGLFACKSENTSPSGPYSSGILGPSCYKQSQQPPICDAPGPGSSGNTTNVCLPNVGGRVLKLDVQDEEIEAVYQCPATDVSCASPTCTSGCNPASQCVKQETYEVEMALYDENGNPIAGNYKFAIREVGGTVEEAIGYFILTDGDPTIYCLSGVGGNTVCVCSGSPGKCPAQ